VVFVRTSEVLSRYKGAIQARESFQRETSALAEEVKQLEAGLQGLIKGEKTSDSKTKDRMFQMRSRIENLRQRGAQRDQELTMPMLAEVNSGIKKFAQRHGYKLIVGTQNGGVVLYGDESVDVTEALIGELNR
jgi:Skp family chaperone for outer membrane proteins